jgi:hypothetical protein
MNNQRILACCLFLVNLVACSSENQKFRPELELEKSIECSNLYSKVWPALHNLSVQEVPPTSWQEVETFFSQHPDNKIRQVVGLIEILKKHLGEAFWKKSTAEQTEIWAQIELKLKVNPAFEVLFQDLKFYEENVFSAGTQNCSPPHLKGQELNSELSVGMKRLMAGAYQSCESLRLPALDETDQDLQGIKVTGKHKDKIGNVRVIHNKALVQKTHPYLRIQENQNGCFNVMNNPLIYDYGGKTSYPSALGKLISVFKNGGSGSQALGIDCSALVVSSIGLAGLRLQPNLDTEARHTAAFGTSTLIDFPKHFPCFDYVPVGGNDSIKVGDILTVRGHTLIIERVGQDPWGIEGIQNEATCLALDGSRFDFDVFHSSPLFGAVGIQKTSAKAYMREVTTTTKGILKYAIQNCLNRVKEVETRPRWSDVTLVRHKGTPECLGSPLQLEGQACVSHCW